MFDIQFQHFEEPNSDRGGNIRITNYWIIEITNVAGCRGDRPVAQKIKGWWCIITGQKTSIYPLHSRCFLYNDLRQTFNVFIVMMVSG